MISDQPKGSLFSYDITDTEYEEIGPENMPFPDVSDWHPRGSGTELLFAAGVIALWAVVIFVAFWNASA